MILIISANSNVKVVTVKILKLIVLKKLVIQKLNYIYAIKKSIHVNKNVRKGIVQIFVDFLLIIVILIIMNANRTIFVNNSVYIAIDNAVIIFMKKIIPIFVIILIVWINQNVKKNVFYVIDYVQIKLMIMIVRQKQLMLL